jgi:FKBP-type peptidyl-prolyl cis-trans isomerase (trigger factor)
VQWAPVTEDELVRADMKPLLKALFLQLQRSGYTEDQALTMTAEEERRMKAQWEAAKAADGL